MADPILIFDRQHREAMGAVAFVLRCDRRRRFRFACISSPNGRRLLGAYDLVDGPLTQPVLLVDGEAYRGVAAWFRILMCLAFPWPLLLPVAVLPAAIRRRIFVSPFSAGSNLGEHWCGSDRFL